LLSIADIRRDYSLKSLSEEDIHADPKMQFDSWWKEAIESQISEVNAMSLCTVDDRNRPQGRIVLLKNYDARGFVFFTNYASSKGKELEVNPFASLVFFWKELERQVRICGSITKVPAEESDEYFHSRPVGSQLGAIASAQSTPIAGRDELEEKMQELEKDFGDSFIPRPLHWGGYLLTADYYEFWQGRSNRLHDRISYQQTATGWKIQRLAP
jgi:pyridoxamine 5'-phosphate oxidase